MFEPNYFVPGLPYVDGIEESMPLQFPFVAVAGGKRQERLAPVAEDGDPHVVLEPRRIPVGVCGVHQGFTIAIAKPS